MRFFLVSPSAYEQTRAALDAHFGHPVHGSDGRVVTETCLSPADSVDTFRHPDGRIVAVIQPEWLALDGVPEAIAGLLARSAAEEITEGQYALTKPQFSIPSTQ